MRYSPEEHPQVAVSLQCLVQLASGTGKVAMVQLLLLECRPVRVKLVGSSLAVLLG